MILAGCERIKALEEHLEQYNNGTNAMAAEQPFVGLLSDV